MGIKGEDSHWKIETVKILIQQVGTFHSIFKTGFSTSPSLNNFTQIPYTTSERWGKLSLNIGRQQWLEKGGWGFVNKKNLSFSQIFSHSFKKIIVKQQKLQKGQRLQKKRFAARSVKL